MTTYVHEQGDGRLVEYRRHPYHPTVLHLEGRVLKPDGTPHDDCWFRVSDSELLGLQEQGSDIIELLSKK